MLDIFHCLIAALETPALLHVIQVCGSLLKMFILRTNLSEVKRLPIRNRGFAMMWVAAFHPEVLVHLRGLDMQVSTYLSILQNNPCVQEGKFFSRPRSCKFNSRMVMVELSEKTRRDGSPWSHMAKMSLVYLYQTRGILFWVCRNSHSSFPMNKLVYDGAMAVPWIRKKNFFGK